MFCPRWRSTWSITTMAIIASAMGVARIPTQGSWRPWVTTSTGCPSRFTYTALGDNVNLAARLESANKQQGTGVLLSDACVQRLSDPAGLEYVNEIRVKGKARPVKVYTVIGTGPTS